MSKRSTLPAMGLVAALILFGSLASAQNLAETYRLATQNLLLKAKEMGVEAGVAPSTKIDSLIEAAKTVRYVELENFIKPEGALRWTAFYQPSTRTVFLNKSASHLKEPLAALSLHETLGALGYRDKDYQISLGIFLMAEKIPKIPLTESQKNQKRELSMAIFEAWRLNESQDLTTGHNPDEPDSILSKGGSNGVGGGGDGEALLYKTMLISALTSDKRFTNPEIYFQIGLHLHLDLTTDPNVQKIQYGGVSIGMDSWAAENTSEETSKPAKMSVRWVQKLRKAIRILVPYKLAQPLLDGADPSSDPGVQDIALFFRSLLGGRFSEAIKYSCNGHEDLTYVPRRQLHPDLFVFSPSRLQSQIKSETLYRSCLADGQIPSSHGK